MARLITEGAEMGDTLFFDVNFGMIVSATSRSGHYWKSSGTCRQ